METSTLELKKALNALDSALALEKSDIVRDGTIQRYEYSIELAWKTAKKVMGSASTAPKVIVREMASQGLIDDPARWLDYLDDRNLSSHTYKEEIAERVYQSAGRFAVDARKLLEKLEQLLKKK